MAVPATRGYRDGQPDRKRLVAVRLVGLPSCRGRRQRLGSADSPHCFLQARGAARGAAQSRCSNHAIAQARGSGLHPVVTSHAAGVVPMHRLRFGEPRVACAGRPRGQCAVAGSEQAHTSIGRPLARQSERRAARSISVSLIVGGQWSEHLSESRLAESRQRIPRRRLRRGGQDGRRRQASFPAARSARRRRISGKQVVFLRSPLRSSSARIRARRRDR
jgi:hypothetical protein